MGAATASAEATAKLAELQEQRDRAATRLDAVERQAREAGIAVQQRAAELAEVERTGGTAKQRADAETGLAKARSAADQQLWQARQSGAQQGLRDCDQAIRAHITEHFPPLLAVKEAAGEVVAQRFNELLAELVACWLERVRIASEIGWLATKVGPVAPGDVSRSAADELAKAATALINAGGEVAPALSRINEPWATLLAAAPGPVSA